MSGRHRNGDDEGLEEEAAKAAAPSALGKTMRRGAKISAFALVFVQVVSLVGTLLQARFLDPAEVGLYAAGTVLTGFMVMFAEGGLRLALVQRETDIENAADTVFWVTFAGGVVMSLAALAAAPIVGKVFGNDDAADIAAITSGMLLMYALINVPEGLLQRNFNFKKRLFVDPGRSLAFAVVSVTMAASGFGVWSLVVGNYVSLGVWLVGVWVFAGWRPGRGRFSYRLWREMARFSFPLLIDRVVEQARESGQTALLGRGLGEASLGSYRYGRRLAMLPGTAVIEVGSYVIFPAFSRLNGDPERLKSAFLRALRWIWFGAAPVAGLIIALGEPAIVVLLGEKWREAGLFFVAMAGFGLGVALQSVASEAIKGSGRTQLLNWTSAVNLVLGLGLLVALLPFGLVGVGLAISATEIALGVLTLVLARRVVDFGIGEVVRPLLPPVVGALVALFVIGPLELWVSASDERFFVIGLLLLIVETIGFGLVYLAVLRVLDREMFAAVIGGIRSKLSRRRQGEPEADADEDGYDLGDAETMILPAVAMGLSVSDAGEMTTRLYRGPAWRPSPFPRTPPPGVRPGPGGWPGGGPQYGRPTGPGGPGAHRVPPRPGVMGPGAPGARGWPPNAGPGGPGPNGALPGVGRPGPMAPAPGGRPPNHGGPVPPVAPPSNGAPPDTGRAGQVSPAPGETSAGDDATQELIAVPSSGRPRGSAGSVEPPVPRVNGIPQGNGGPAAPGPNAVPPGNGMSQAPASNAAAPGSERPSAPGGPRPSPRPRAVAPPTGSDPAGPAPRDNGTEHADREAGDGGSRPHPD
ncbi:oligosaccharide flippase family protein [Pseudonocardia bannensis]|uniref:lipopolysaccharide biosynthesis protein n=1 Tax=Pseudonocardia bannensis TaxID=630973 RepID=UPI001B7CFADD|nr:oligosaccharide flippase family protein [Pseudonocardia bannensis]